MNKKPIAIGPALFFATVFASMIALTSTVRADSKHVTFIEPVTIGGTVLAPGIYSVVWEGSGPEVQVSFMKDNKTLATASANLVLEKSPYRRSYITTDSPENPRVLMRIRFSKTALVFDRSS